MQTFAACGVGSLATYGDLEQVGEGTYGYVFRARDKRTAETVALKRLIVHKESQGFPLCSIREIKFLKSLQHKNIVRLKDIVTSKGCEHMEVTVKPNASKQAADEKEREKEAKGERDNSKILPQLHRMGTLYLVFEYIEHDLGGLIDSKYKFSPRSIKCIMKQLFEVLDFLLERKVLHRDIKSSNILISSRHQVKLADFGLARSSVLSDGREGTINLTNNVITMWYKPPELLLGSQRYSYAVDMWSVGCVLAELELGRPLFPGKTDVEQFELISKGIGTPTEAEWPSMSSLPNYESLFKASPKINMSLSVSYASKLSVEVLTLLERILVHDPSKRTTPRLALSNKYFHTQPLPPQDPTDLDPLGLPLGASLHEFQTKQKRKQREEELKMGIDTSAASVSTVGVVGGGGSNSESTRTSQKSAELSTKGNISASDSAAMNPFTQPSHAVPNPPRGWAPRPPPPAPAQSVAGSYAHLPQHQVKIIITWNLNGWY
jgi:cyclin-dependent kinase 12/13